MAVLSTAAVDINHCLAFVGRWMGGSLEPEGDSGIERAVLPQACGGRTDGGAAGNDRAGAGLACEACSRLCRTRCGLHQHSLRADRVQRLIL